MIFNQMFLLCTVLLGICTLSTCSVATTNTSGGNTYGVEDNVVEDSHSGMPASVFEGCLKKDSISCLQIHIYSMAKNFFDQPSYRIFNGLSLVKVAKQTDKLETVNHEDIFKKSRSFEDKETVIENYIINEAKNFFEKRNLNWNMAVLARNIADVAPEGIKKVANELMAEGRGRKKVLRILLPFILGLKVKFATILGIAYLGVILLAKKAIFVSIISVAISIFLLLKKMFHHTHEEVYPHAHRSGWQSHSDAGHVEYGTHTSSTAQHLAYAGSNPTEKR